MRIFHIAVRSGWKHVENSLRGIRKALRLHYPAIDIDILITKDNVVVACHWDRPMVRDQFHDPAHRIQVHDMVRELTWEQISTLRAPGGYRIQRIETILRECARDKIIAYLEPKDDKRFEEDWPWQHIVACAKEYGTRVWVRSIRNFATPGAGVRRVEAAIRNGIPRRHTSIINK